MTKTKTIKVDVLARVEGEGSLYLKIEDDRVTDAKLKIFEPPRFFEAFLQGRDFREAPDITARICGICPIAYQMSSCHAMEDILKVQLHPALHGLRRLLYCGEWIESHTLHIAMLHAPDFLGYAGSLEMAKDHPDIVKRSLRLKRVGNLIMETLGGREIHPINVKVGGFYRAPTPTELKPLREELLWARETALEMVRWVSAFDFPEFSRDYEFVALSHPDEYAINEGRLISNRGLDIHISEFEDHFEEIHVEHSNALHAVHKGHGAYMVGPLARFALNFEQLSPLVKETAKEIGLSSPCTNPFKSIVVRSLELLYACDESIRLLDEYKEPEASFVELEIKAGTGYGCTEAPRGICYHRYSIDEQGLIETAKIVPPTSQNQMSIEADLLDFANQYVHLPDEQLTLQCEQAIRNYDPCISCATHFLKLDVDRGISS